MALPSVTLIALVVLLLVSVAMPLGYAWRVWRLRALDRCEWLLVAGEAVAFLALIALIARWDIAGLWTRWVLGAVFAAALVASWRRHAGMPWRATGERAVWRRQFNSAVSAGALCVALVWLAVGMLVRHDPQGLAFPLRGGTFVVGHGGDLVALNYHNSHPAQRHAIDVTAVGAAGFRAPGLLPPDPADYMIFGVEVVSPCDGEVVESRDGLPDLTPPERDRENAAGNHVVLSCGGLLVTLAHLRQGSVAVSEGDAVRGGQVLGEVGNSGNTTEPHLHAHATDAEGIAVQIAWDGRMAVRNSVFRR